MPLQSSAVHTRAIQVAIEASIKVDNKAAKAQSRGFRSVRQADKLGRAKGEAEVAVYRAIAAALDDGYGPVLIMGWFPDMARDPQAGPAFERMIERARQFRRGDG